jgi:hypothetical protein
VGDLIPILLRWAVGDPLRRKCRETNREAEEPNIIHLVQSRSPKIGGESSIAGIDPEP